MPIVFATAIAPTDISLYKDYIKPLAWKTGGFLDSRKANNVDTR